MGRIFLHFEHDRQPVDALAALVAPEGRNETSGNTLRVPLDELALCRSAERSQDSFGVHSAGGRSVGAAASTVARRRRLGAWRSRSAILASAFVSLSASDAPSASRRTIARASATMGATCGGGEASP